MNEAFIIDNQTKDALIAEDPKSAEVIKPVLRGRDIQRYQAQWRQLWLIATFPALALNIDDYPAVKRHLLLFDEQRLEQSGKQLPNGGRSRKKTTNAWFEMQDTCAYHEHFSRPKLFWADMAATGRFAFSDQEVYCNNKGYIITGRSLKYLCAVLNSAPITWWVQNTAATTGMGLTEWTIATVERLPVPRISYARQSPFVRLVDCILRSDTDQTETAVLESQIDELVCELYGLTGDERQAINGK